MCVPSPCPKIFLRDLTYFTDLTFLLILPFYWFEFYFTLSPRIEFQPKSFPNEFEDLLKPVDPDQGLPAQPVKITDALVAWRDEEGNTLLHLAAWKGRIHLSRAFFDSVKGRKLVTVQNRKGAVPLAMAIINGQVNKVDITEHTLGQIQQFISLTCIKLIRPLLVFLTRLAKFNFVPIWTSFL